MEKNMDVCTYVIGPLSCTPVNTTFVNQLFSVLKEGEPRVIKRQLLAGGLL